MKMSKRALVALEKSILERWVPRAKGKCGDKECALCCAIDDCSDCPIMRQTLLPGCRATPYHAWDVCCDEYGIDDDSTIFHATNMLAFLLKLHPTWSKNIPRFMRKHEIEG